MIKKFLLAAAVLGCLASCSRPSPLEIPLDGGILCIEPLREDAMRVRFVPEGARLPEELIFTEKAPAPSYRVQRLPGGDILIATERMQARYCEATGALSFLDADGMVLLEEKPGPRQPDAVTFLSPEYEHLYGTGQFQDGYLDIRGLTRRLTQVNTQISVPMILSSRGYGLLWHSYGLTEFNPAGESLDISGGKTVLPVQEAGEYAFLLDSGEKMSSRQYLAVDGKVLADYTNIWLPPTVAAKTFLEAGEHLVETVSSGAAPLLFWRRVSDETTFRSPGAPAVDYTVFAGKADEVQHAFRCLSGHVPEMPEWMFRYIHCRERYDTQEELLAAARRFHEENLPVGTIVQDWQYWGKLGWNAMQFDPDKYPDPAAMVEQVHGLGQHIMLSVWSKMDPGCEVGKQMQENGFFIPGTEWVDFFRKEAADTYWNNFRERLLPLGFDAWWQDATEPENDDLAGRRIGPEGVPGELYRNVYPLKVIETVAEGLRKEGKTPVILTRSAFSGMQRYGAVTWSGDVLASWESFRRQIVAGLGQMAAGLPWWTMDAGGFFRPSGQYTDPAYQELMIRWIQASVYLPFMRVHGYMSRTEPWEYPAPTRRLFEDCIRRREALLPYITECARRVTEEDYTLMRPLVFDFPGDAQALRQETEYMFGPDYLVCPVTEPGVNVWRVYLPVNIDGWEEVKTGKKFDGGSYYDIPVDLEGIPVFRRIQNGLADFLNETLPVGERVQDLLGRLTADEKIGLLRATAPAIPRLGIPKYNHGNEALHGIVRPGRFTVFPQAIGLASTWDPALLKRVSTVASDEARARWNELGRGELQKAQYSDLLTFWSPTVNMARDPRWGRTPETYGEDPFLTGELGAAFVQGLQGDDPRYLKVVSTPKHFTANNEEHNRFECNALISEKQMREYYLPAFESCIRRGRATSIMTAYNAINGIPCTGNPWLLKKVLRDQWGFGGYVVSDCGAPDLLRSGHHYVQTKEEAATLALTSGLDLECGDDVFVEPLRKALAEGKVPMADIDRAARNVLTARMRLGLFDDPSHNPYNRIPPSVVGCAKHKELALQAAREAIVLLKNEGAMLPLKRERLRSLAVVGINAATCEFGDYSGVPVGEPVSILEGIRSLAGPEVEVKHVPWKSEEAARVAASCDAVVAVMGINREIEREGKDRDDIGLPAYQVEFLQELHAANPRLVLVLVAGSSLSLEWEQEHIPAIVNAWYPGEQGGTAVAEVLFGDYNPAGRLPLTYYRSVDDLPPFDDYDITKRTYKYFEGPVLYPFGYGLSYTSFAYSGLRVRDRGDRVEVSFTLKNEGPCDGEEVAQVYVRIPGYEGKAPIKELRGFERVFLRKGESRKITVPLRREDLRYWSESRGCFVVPEALPEVLVGASSADIRLTSK